MSRTHGRGCDTPVMQPVVDVVAALVVIVATAVVAIILANTGNVLPVFR